ncbi:DUF1697 domain-containing protein [Actinokineospora pegani]|uniref:DUF1697 domain-containing protein n=1 Tax=Actinokineospora pegani TaxID=2654637 RepID=UPI0012E9D0D4|nr:DUF1697 domain-containing protein [Actinokineospora pegani]
MATSHIVLLRGINVGKHNRIAMGPLRDMLTALGHTNVRTLLNSGNAVVTTDTDDPAAVAREVRKGIEDTFGLSIHTVVRSRGQVERIIERNPMPDEAAREPKLFHVGFGDPAPERKTVDAIDHDALGDERVVLDEGTLYVWFADGVRDSRLAKVLSANKLDRSVTMRNWNTVRKLVDLAES